MQRLSIIFCLCLIISAPVIAYEQFSKAPTFSIGITQPTSPSYFQDSWSRGLALHGAMSYVLLPVLRSDIVLQLNAFSYDDDDSWGGNIVLTEIGGELNLHLLPVDWRVSPFLTAGLSPVLGRIGEIVTDDMVDPDDPYSSEPSYFWDIGVMSKYGAGISVLLGQETHLWFAYKQQHYRSIAWHDDKLRFRSIQLGIYFFTD